MGPDKESRPSRESGAASKISRQAIHPQSTPIGPGAASGPPMLARIDLDDMDYTAVAVLGGILQADRHRAATALETMRRTLPPGYLPQPVAEAFTACRGVIADGHAPDPSTVADHARDHGIIPKNHHAQFFMMLVDATDWRRCPQGDRETFRAHLVALGAAREHVTATGTRLLQAAEEVADDDMPGLLAALAEDTHRTADRFAALSGGEPA